MKVAGHLYPSYILAFNNYLNGTRMQTQTIARPTELAGPRRFFLVFSMVLLGIVLTGFAPTLFLRALTNPLPIPFYLHLHGALVTGWFLLMVLQAWLIRQQNPQLHRKLGYFGALYGVVVMGAGLMATFGVVPRALQEGVSFDTDIGDMGIPGLGAGIPFLLFISRVVWTNIMTVIAFAALLALAVVFRARPDYHKRFILLTTVSIVGAAITRISRWPGLGGEQGPFIPAALLTLLISLVVYDVFTLRKVHKATWVGIVVILLSVAAGNGIGGSIAGQEFVRSLA
jgi:hypothetical protein